MSRLALLAAACLLAVPCARADEPPATDWRETAAKAGLPAPAVEALARDRFVVAGRSELQVFGPYLDHESSLPVFVTADSILAAYHVLFAESFLRVERARARRLPGALDRILRAVPTAAGNVGPPEALRAGRLRATRILGTALALLGHAPEGLDEVDRTAIREEAARVEAGEGRAKPSWLGPPEPEFLGFDYGRFRPRGPYARAASLARHWRAWSWLQAVPLRLSNADEMATAVVLSAAFWTAQAQDGEDAFPRELFSYGSLVPDAGPPAAWDQGTHLPDDLTPSGLDAFLVGEGKDIVSAPVNDVLASSPMGPSVRIVRAAALPDAVLFQRTAGGASTTRRPDAREVCALLGDAASRDALGKDSPVGEALSALGTSWNGDSVYEEHLRCLAALLDDPEPEAPPFVRTPAWRRRLCGSVLGAWAQSRRTLALSATETMKWLGEVTALPGFVEPDPEFFSRLGALARDTQRAVRTLDTTMGSNRADERDTHEDLAADLRVLARAVDETLKTSIPDRATWAARPADEGPALERAWLFFRWKLDWSKSKERPFWEDAARRVRALADALEDPKAPLDPDTAYVLRSRTKPLDALWSELELTAFRLAALAHKQLRGVAFSAEEGELLAGYGEILARIMLYEGNSYLSPSDDAPRCAAVFHDTPAAAHWIVGIGRPRRIYVLYPFGGRDHLCRGAVLPYLETRAPEPLSDEEWRALIDAGGDARPRPPEWLRAALPDD